MAQRLDTLGAFWTADGMLLPVAALLLVVLTATLPPGSRRKLLVPLAFFALHLVVALGAALAVGSLRTRLELLALFLLTMTTARGAGLFVSESSLTKRVIPPMPKIFEDLLQAFLYALAVLATLRLGGVDMGSLFATSAVLSAVVGFALQDTLGNVFAGLSVQAQKAFNVGDWVEVDGSLGRVLEIGWRATKLRTLDEVDILVPNGALARHTIRNFTKPTDVSRRSIQLSAAYDAPPERVKAVALSALEGIPDALTDPAPSVVLSGFGDSGVLYTLYYFTRAFALATWTDSAVREHVWYAFRRAGITIPFPQRDLHVVDTSKEARAALATARAGEREAALATVAFFALIPSDALRALADRCTSRLYAAGETILRQGDPGDDLFVVLRGEVVVLLEASLAGTRPVEIARLGKDQFFGEMSLMTGARRAATIRATQECELLVVGHNALRPLLTAHPELVERLSLMLAKRQLELDERQLELPVEAKADLDARSTEILGKIRAFFGSSE
ncbi:MAG TPA: mechanosensitive ion channel family protein [Polyangiaceae bacterium]|nr:mechanosensitive ion channel family protein [Polyangiaceae bacterium]